MNPPFHPFFVHFPLALLPVSFFCEAIALIWKRDELSRAGWWTQLVGTIGLLLAVGSGLLTERNVNAIPGAPGFLETHEELAFANAVLFVGLLLWRIGMRSQIPRQKMIFFSLFGAGIILLFAGGWFGGELVFRFGVGVPR